MENIKDQKPWYKKTWGIILTVLLFPFVVPYLVWTKTDWNKWIKIGITIFCAIIVISSLSDNSANTNIQKSQDLIVQAETAITEERFNDALSTLEQAKKLKDPNEIKAQRLILELQNYQSSDFLKKTLVDLSDEEVESLNLNALEASFFTNEDLNRLFLVELSKNVDARDSYIAEVEEIRKRQAEEAETKRIAEEAQKRQDKIEFEFSPWDGSHRNLTRLVKGSMNDPKSYDHIETAYIDNGDHLIVTTRFRGANAFGGLVVNTVKAKVSLDGDVLEIISQN